MKTKTRILITILAAVAVLAGCQATPEKIAADTAVVTAYQDLNTKRIAMVNGAMESCKLDAAAVNACESDLCRVDIARESSACHRAVVDAAGKVALELPQARASTGAVIAQEIGSTIRTVIPFATSYAQTRNVVHAMRDVSIGAGRPNIDQSTTTTTTTTTRDSGNTTSGDTFTAGRDLAGGDQSNSSSRVTVGGNVVGRDDRSGNTGRQDSGGDNCSGPQCQPSNILNPVDNSQLPPESAPPPTPGDADGICFTFSLVTDPDCGP